MIPANEVRRGYWFLDNILKKPIQATTDGQTNFVNERRYTPLPVTRELLLRFGFTEMQLQGMKEYNKNGFKIYRHKLSDTYQLMQYGELHEKIEYMHHLQKKYREEVVDAVMN